MMLSDTHLLLLSAAAQHEHHLLPRPDNLFGKALDKMAARLTSTGLAEDVAVNQDQPHWSVNEAGEAIGLRITAAGLAALGITEETSAPPAEADQGSPPAPVTAPPQPRPGTKRAMLVDMLRQEQGVSVEALMAATGWLPHTVRAALTGLRKTGHHLAKNRNEAGMTLYQLTESSSEQAPRVRSERMGAVQSLIEIEPVSTAGADTASALDREIASLGDLDLHALRSRWRQRLRGPPPDALTRPLLLRLLAYRLQARALGDLDPDAVRFLDRIARANADRRDGAGTRKAKAVSPVPPVPPVRGLKPGTLLAREHGGTMHRVIVMADGFSWNGARYGSLSEIARAITGTRWNGPRFFGLRATTISQTAGGPQ